VLLFPREEKNLHPKVRVNYLSRVNHKTKAKKKKQRKYSVIYPRKKGKAKPGLLIKRGSRPVLYLHKLETMITK